MGYIDFDYQKNSVFIGKGKVHKEKDLKLINRQNNYSAFEINGQFKGIEINDFHTTLEQDGFKAELAFKKLLDSNNIPCLYIGQSPFGKELSDALMQTTESKRADFLVNLKGIGSILFDVKCRTKIPFHDSKETYFYIYPSDLKALLNLQETILIPVWIAFTDRESINKNDLPIFHFVAISDIIKFSKKLNAISKERQKGNEFQVIRIPNTILTENKEKITFQFGHGNIDTELISEFAVRQIECIAEIENIIIKKVTSKRCHKSNLYNTLREDGFNLCHEKELLEIIQCLIDKKVVNYVNREYLTVS